MKDGYHVNCTVSSNFLLDKGRVAENLQKECFCYFINSFNVWVIFTILLLFPSERHINGGFTRGVIFAKMTKRKRENFLVYSKCRL